MPNTTPFNNEDTSETYQIFVEGKPKGRVWFAVGAQQWTALVRVAKKAVERNGKLDTLDSLLSQVKKDFKGQTVEFRYED